MRVRFWALKALLFGVAVVYPATIQADDGVVSLLPTYHEGSTADTHLAHPAYRWERNIVATIFWVGERADSVRYRIDNLGSAWNDTWERSFGGLDSPGGRIGYLPGGFVPHENPFYVALPFNDLKYPQMAAQWVPWWNPHLSPQVSQCRGRWLEIKTPDNKVCYAQWEDAGPFRCDDASYVFDPRAINPPQAQAGIDVSPAVGTLLGLDGHNVVTWRFVDSSEVPDGPWLKHEECVPALEKLSRAADQAEPVLAYTHRSAVSTEP